MLGRQTNAALLCVLIAGPAWAQPVSIPEAKAFFDLYVRLNHTFDKAIIDLYLDGGRIKTLRRYPIARDRMVENSGAQWKSLLKKTLPLAKTRNDRSRFKNMEFVQVGSNVRIEADRYSLEKCYWDHGYYMIVTRQQDQKLKIIEENFETLPQANCKLVSSNFSG